MPGVGRLVHGIQVQSGFKLRLTAGKEHDARDGRGHTAAKHLEGVVSDFLGTRATRALSTRSNHGRLQEDALEKHTVVCQILERLGPGHLSNLQGAVDVVVAIQKDLRLHNGDQASILGNGCIACKPIGAVAHGNGGGASRDGHHRAPLGKASTRLVVFSAPLGQAVQAGAPRFVVRVGQRVQALVDLDTGNNALLIQAIHHALARASVLEEGLLEENGARDVLAKAGGGDQEFTVRLAVFDSVFETNRFKALSAGGVRLVHGEDALASGGNLFLQIHELLATFSEYINNLT